MRLQQCVAVAAATFSSLSQAATAGSNDELFWSYGRSPPVQAPPTGMGVGNWSEAYTRAKSAVAGMSNEEKQNMTIGLTPQNGCSGVSGGANSAKFPGMCLSDGPTGVRATELVTSFPSGIHIGASWNLDLAFDIGKYMGAEFRRKGVHVALGPVVGPLGRVARGGRNWEGFTNDPFLAGKLAAVTVEGLQKSVVACVKHLIGNEQEELRNPTPLTGFTASVSSNIDDRTMHELYLWPFQDAVRAGVGSVMCSYQRINNSYGCQNSKVLNGLLKQELSFQGFVVSDWGAQHAGIDSSKNGLDMVMPNSAFWGNALVAAVKNGSLPQSRLDDMAVRILAPYYLLGMDKPEFPPLGIGMPKSVVAPHTRVDARDPASKKAVFQAAVEGHVLVKNTNNILPLKSPKILSLFGSDGPAPRVNNPSGALVSKWNLGAISVADPSLPDLLSVLGGTAPSTATSGTLTFGGGSGSSTGSYISSPFGAFEQKAWEDDIALHWDFQAPNPDVNPASDACIVFINEYAIEGLDRPGLADGGADKLVTTIANKCVNTIVVIHNAGIRLVDPWIDHPNVKAVLLAHLPGQDSGRALIEVLFGNQSPSGRLPYTLAKKAGDYGPLLNPSSAGTIGSNTFQFPQSDFSEGLYIDYKAFLKANIAPRYPFGYGLTYTSFTYSGLSVNTTGPNLQFLPPQSLNVEGGPESLFEVLAVVNFDVRNSGAVAAAEVAQLYVGIPGAPTKQLRGFAKKLIQPGETAKFTLQLTRRDLSIWDVGLQSWVLPRGEYAIAVGKSVLDTPLQTSIRVS